MESLKMKNLTMENSNVNEEILLYSTGCPKCKVIEAKLRDKNVPYIKVDDREEMIKKDILNVPVLEIGNELMGFVEANEWINNYSAFSENI